jgi:hypothetical protein
MEPLRSEAVELRATVSYLAEQIADMKHEFRGDIRRLDDRVFQLMLVTLATLATTIASLVANVVS